MKIENVIDPIYVGRLLKFIQFVIPAKAGIQLTIINTGFRIKHALGSPRESGDRGTE